MNMRTLGILSITTLVFTVLWLVFLIAGMASAKALDTFPTVLAYASQAGRLYSLTYLNAALVTLSCTALMAGLYSRYKNALHGWMQVGLVFIPVYTTLNLFVYLSQVTLVPELLRLHTLPESQAAAEMLLRQLIQVWPESAAAFFNNLAYALLGIPSIIFGGALIREGGLLRWGGALLALNGIACWLSVVGMLVGSAALSNGSVVGGVFFLLALIPLSIAFFRSP